MWQWLKQMVSRIIAFFARLRTPVSASTDSADTTSSDYSNPGDSTGINNSQHDRQTKPLLKLFNTKHSFDEIKKRAFFNLEDARILMQRTDLKDQMGYEELCKVIYNHRKGLDNTFIKDSLTKNQISFLDLARHSASNALTLFKSRFLNNYTAAQLAEVYYTHRHDKTFVTELVQKRDTNTSYPQANLIPPILYILNNANREGCLRDVYQWIVKSTTLLLILKNEMGPAQHQRQHDKAIQLPKNDPYVILGLQRDASDQDVVKAYRRLALCLHPDKIESKEGNRFKALGEAYEFLKDPEKRKAWDDAHPISMDSERPPMHR